MVSDGSSQQRSAAGDSVAGALVLLRSEALTRLEAGDLP